MGEVNLLCYSGHGCSRINKKQAANPQQHIVHLFEKTKKSSDFVQISITNEIDFILNCQIKDAPPEIDLTETKNILFLEQTIHQHHPKIRIIQTGVGERESPLSSSTQA